MKAKQKLKILIVANPMNVNNLSERINMISNVEVLRNVDNAHYAWGEIRKKHINTIIINPFDLGYEDIDEAARFIFRVRQEFPGIPFILYGTEKDWTNSKDQLFNVKKGKVEFLSDEEFDIYKLERTRLAHYFRIVESIDEEKFHNQIHYAVSQCLKWHNSLELLRKTNIKFKYDVALSFAGEDREYANQLAHELSIKGVRVFYDQYEEAFLWGKNLFESLHEIYSKKSRYCIILMSKAYKEKMWTNHERRAAQERALQERGEEYILPVKIEDVQLPGFFTTTAYLDSKKGTKKIAKLLEEKLLA